MKFLTQTTTLLVSELFCVFHFYAIWKKTRKHKIKKLLYNIRSKKKHIEATLKNIFLLYILLCFFIVRVSYAGESAQTHIIHDEGILYMYSFDFILMKGKLIVKLKKQKTEKEQAEFKWKMKSEI